MIKTFSTAKKQERAILVALITPQQSEDQVKEYLEELKFLATTAGITTELSITQKLDHPDVRTFVRKGKLEEIKTAIKVKNLDVIIFDDDLSPSQLRNLEKELQIKIYDRSLLILDIFLKRARTARATTQVELARNEYLLPRLTRMWTHLERQRGGTGTRGGAGEKEIETDRRMIRNQITVLKKKLEKIDRQSENQRKGRSGIVKVSLVGYTNVGKSTIMRILSKADVFAENKLFATLDSTVRKVVINQIPFLLTDTVGFIRKLPHALVESFKSTLDEVREADILVHVIDISHPYFEDQIKVVNDTLKEIVSLNKPTVMVFNKMDLYRDKKEPHENGIGEKAMMKQLNNQFANTKDVSAVFISANNKENMDGLREVLIREVSKIHFQMYPNNRAEYDLIYNTTES